MMIYGASGYTGRMIVDACSALGLRPILAGRRDAPLRALADTHGLDARVFAADDARQARRALAEIDLLVNCAGPFHRTAPHLIAAAIDAGTHYLDISAELDSYRLAESLDTAARRAGVMLMPGGGGSTALLGSLVARVCEQVRHPARIAVALQVAGPMSRGSAISAAENLSPHDLVRRHGVLQARHDAAPRRFDFGALQADGVPMTLPDVITLWHDHAVPDIETYVHVVGNAFASEGLDTLPPGPTDAERRAHPYHAAAVVTDRDGASASGTLATANGYTFTPLATADAARRILAGNARPGFQTPTGLFGPAFAQGIAGTRITVHPSHVPESPGGPTATAFGRSPP